MWSVAFLTVALFGAVISQETITLSQKTSGTVQVNLQGVAGTVCDDQFGKPEAEVVCRKVGSKTSVAAPVAGGVFSSGTGRILYDNLNCVGTEQSLENCPTGGGLNDCFHSEDAAVICDPSDIQYRLVDGATATEGRVEINVNGVWGTMCDDEFDAVSARVLCKQLGFPSKYATPTTVPSGKTTAPIYFDDVKCVGPETNILQCNMTAIGDNDCDHTEDVGVICSDQPPNVQVRLQGGSSTDEGRVEVNFGKGWGTVCDDGWTVEDAKVVCNMLGFKSTNPRPYGQSYFGSGTGTIIMDDVDCDGTESSLGECNYGGYGNHDCDHSEDAGVSCSGKDAGGVTAVRLVGGATSTEGRVEVNHGGRWGTVCDDNFDDREARVICKMLGFNGTSVAVGINRFPNAPSSTGPIFMDELQCSGTETNLGDCQFDGYGQHDCDHSEDAGVICNAGNQTSGLRLRLVNGKSVFEGRLEVFYRGQWGTVCDDQFDYRAAKVACRSMGFSESNAQAVHGAHFGQGTGPIILDNVACRGTEDSLSSCRHNAYFTNNCDHDEDVGIRCEGKTESPVRLTGSTVPYEGRLEIFHNSAWGSVCSDGFNQQAAQVVCTMLGYPSDTPVIKQTSTGNATSSMPIWMNHVVCNGNETSLDQCSHDRWGDNHCAHNQDVAIQCRAHGITCYHCDGLTDPKTCKETMTCAAGESCEEAAYVMNGLTRFSLTCQSKLVCDAIANGNPIIGRKRQAQTVQVKCCDTPLCNKMLIDYDPNAGTGTGTGACQDKVGTDCNGLDTLNICANAQAAKLYCPKHCGLCT